MDKATLIKHCKEGDKAALGLLYMSYSKQMMRVICQYVTDWTAAQDILHDGFLIIFGRISQLREPDKLEYWMAAIMKNLALHYLKSQDVMQLLEADFDIPDVPGFEESISMEELEAMIRRLPSGYQRVFRLAVLEHKTHKEIGRLLGISEGTSGSQLFHARALIKKMILEHKIESGLMLVALAALFAFFSIRRADDAALTTVAEAVEPSVPASTVLGMHDDHGYVEALKAYEPAEFVESAESAESVEPAATDTITLAVIPAALADSTREYAADGDTTISLRQQLPTSGLRTSRLTLSSPGKLSGYNVSVVAQVTSPHDTETRHYFESGYSDLSFLTEESEHEFPITFSVGVSKTLSERISLESGLQYSLLHSRHKLIESTQDVKVHYLGVPLRLRFTVWSMGYFAVYGSSGIMAEFPVRGNVTLTERGESDGRKLRFTPPIQWSVSLGTGVEYNPTPQVGVFVEPSINYYFKASSPYTTIRQARPFEITLPVGLRYKW